jgi:PrtD family type I secretion system ABC transporter
LSFFINVMKLAIPIYIFQLLDRVIASRSVETLLMLTVMTVCAVITAAVAEIVRRWMLMRWGGWIERRFGRRLLLMSLQNETRRRPSASLRDLGTLRQFVSGSAATAWLDVIWAPAFLLVVYLIHPLIALILVAGVLVMAALGTLSELVTRSARSAATKATEDRGDWLATAERRSETIGSLKIAGNLADRWDRSSSERITESLSTRWYSLTSAETLRFVENLIRIGSYGVGVWLVLKGELSVGGGIAAALLARMASSTARHAMASWQKLASARLAYLRINLQLADGSATLPPVLDPLAAPPLTIEDLGHRYAHQENSLFRNLDLTLQPGEVLSVIGPSGSGKSTLTRILVGYLRPRSGVVRLGDADIIRYAPEDLSGYIGYLQQEVQLFRGTIGENIARLGREDFEQTVEAAKLAGIHEVITRLPLGYETRIEGEGDTLSAGERKRIGLARALYGRPRLIVLDEPAANLDEAFCDALKRAIIACKCWGAIAVVASHSDTFADVADKVVLLDHSGRTRIYETPKEVRQRFLSHLDANAPILISARKGG